MTELWLLRHGQTDWNVTGRWQGQSLDAPGLNDVGYAQALAALRHLTRKHFAAIYSSDLLRTRQTAELLAESLGLTVTLEPRLREIDLGAWEGLFGSDIESRYPNELAERARDPLHFHAPQGESPLEVAERVIAAAKDIAEEHPNDSVLIVSHGISLAVIICRAEGISLDRIYEHIPDNAKPYRVEWK